MKVLLATLAILFSLNGPVYTDILGHINCQNAQAEYHYVYGDTEVTICWFDEGVMLWTRYQYEDANCIAYFGEQVQCPEALEVY